MIIDEFRASLKKKVVQVFFTINSKTCKVYLGFWGSLLFWGTQPVDKARVIQLYAVWYWWFIPFW